ncbi:MAG TPA: trigger factor [candidate division Zixibacteria bacterium]|nr:trigger factor [candidate division Zixibacteria bacterium]
MKVEVDELNPVRRKIEIELPAETVDEELTRAYRNLARRVRIKGFRAGKAPRTMLETLYGEEIKSEVRSRLVEHALSAALQERGLQIVSRPEIQADPVAQGRAFSFSAVFEVKPEIEVRNYLGLEVRKPRLSLPEDEVERALRRLQESQARLEPVEDRRIARRGDFVTVDFAGTISGRPVPAAKAENYLLEIGGGRSLPEFEEALEGRTIDEPFEVRVPYPADYPNKEIAGQTVDFVVTVRDIKRKVLPPLDDEFAKDHGEFSSLEELKKNVRARLEAELERIQREALKEQLLSRLLEEQAFVPPPAMVERQVRYLMERERAASGGSGPPADSTVAPEEWRRSIEERAKRQVQATLLIEKIARLENVEVSERDLQQRVEAIAAAAGDRGKALREVYSRPETRDELRAQMVFERTLDLLLEKATIREVDPAPS